MDAIHVGEHRADVQQTIQRMRPGDRWRDSDFVGPFAGGPSQGLFVRYDLGGGTYLLAEYKLPPGSEGQEPNLPLQTKTLIDFEDLKPLIAPELYPYVRLVHQSGTIINGWETFDPAKLIRAVNALQSLDKQTALKVLAAYGTLANKDWARQWRYDLEDGRAILVARLLFVRTDGNPMMPWLGYGVPDPLVYEGDRDWPLFPLAVENDVPFLLVAGYGIAGRMERFSDEVDYFQTHCQIRAAPLKPGISPLQAAERIFESARWRRLFVNAIPAEAQEYASRSRLRCQALRAVQQLFPDLPKPAELDLDRVTREQADRAWAKLLNDPRLENVHWDDKAGEFVAGTADGSR
jgi:hypothetical protein